jgi:hypothetical protein
MSLKKKLKQSFYRINRFKIPIILGFFYFYTQPLYGFCIYLIPKVTYKDEKIMKKLLFIGLIAMMFSSCSVDDSPLGQDFHFEILPIEEVLLPESFTPGEFYQIDYSYYKPSTCYTFNELYYLAEGDYRTVAVINTVLDEANGLICEPLEDELEWRTMFFECKKNFGSYIFQFWQGQNENGEDQYLVMEVPVE